MGLRGKVWGITMLFDQSPIYSNHQNLADCPGPLIHHPQGRRGPRTPNAPLRLRTRQSPASPQTGAEAGGSRQGGPHQP